MKLTKDFEIEITRNNVTPSQFLAYVRSRVDAKGGRLMRSDLDLAYFRAGNDLNFDFTHEDPETPELLGVHEKSVSKPYQMQTYIKYPNGAIYNEICEFTFFDDKTGAGYYYLVNVSTEEETPENAPETVEEEPAEKDPTEIIENTIKTVKEHKTRSAWDRGVQAYALELLEELAESIRAGYHDLSDLESAKLLDKALLNGAADWANYSWGGCSLIYNRDIAERLCTPSELRKVTSGTGSEWYPKKPNAREEWLDTQARALHQASEIIKATVRALVA